MPFEPTAAIDRGAPQLREIPRLQAACEDIGVAIANSGTGTRRGDDVAPRAVARGRGGL
ncbi:hypothetical protein VC218_18150 [Xanthomonas nasturtii]|uniref:hypothetical protein n=1 Tax=Xanthomonas nasturtii TaxID=1843581 RepID=UPI002B233DA3|nr:hypothetical protein [Xanthomonas nasturtii]MEA9580744.1 hypothetical protein [Xanthomonas nasturtii]